MEKLQKYIDGMSQERYNKALQKKKELKERFELGKASKDMKELEKVLGEMNKLVDTMSGILEVRDKDGEFQKEWGQKGGEEKEKAAGTSKESIPKPKKMVHFIL